LSKLRSIQVLRGIAAAAVVVHHFYAQGDDFSSARLGAAGVDLFFVISGFIMATVAANRTPRRFLADRCWRIYPVWIIASLPWVIFLDHSNGALLATATLWPIWGDFYSPALGVGWSLCYEMLLYAAFALALATRPIVPLLLYGLFLPLGLVFKDNSLLTYLGGPMAIEFLCGVWIAQLRTPTTRSAFPIIALGCLLFATAPHIDSNIVFGRYALPRILFWGVPSAAVLYGFRSIENTIVGRAWAVPLLVGNASYSIYLFHKLFVAFLPWQLGIPVSISAGVAIYLLLERPILRLKGPLSSLLLTPRAAGRRLIAGPAGAEVATFVERQCLEPQGELAEHA
jgi:exopolysaccharide production protein ExoZ